MENMDTKEQDNGEIGKEPDKTNLEELTRLYSTFHTFVQQEEIRKTTREM